MAERRKPSLEIAAMVKCERALAELSDEGARRRVLVYLVASFSQVTPEELLASHASKRESA